MSLSLQPYEFEIIHSSGKKHGHVDCLSRYPVDTDIQELKHMTTHTPQISHI